LQCLVIYKTKFQCVTESGKWPVEPGMMNCVKWMLRHKAS